eukprot:CAMPEP_0176470266 /NCGR_PEP_ID=MMETSP0127-20121128/40346_1 /TAXON_ID=938130 /ORGANISM="Platyophrya macrostoma, Strain WH" /LENGTH=462 /DNA_ID=CAMNT_0017864513 /DNA_START=114 /DNA_END=1502 /DNA_ORIENTATION=+
MKKYPKTYGLWHHRKWCILTAVNLENTQEVKKKGAILAFEMKLCEQFLAKDERNFHVWNYRGWLTDTIKRTDIPFVEKELEFIESKLSQNFSNFSAIYNKGKNTVHLTKLKVDKLLSQPEETQLTEAEQHLAREYFRFDVPLDFIRTELESVKTGLYMQSKEEPMWLYQKWLLNKMAPIRIQGLVNFGEKDEQVVICIVFSSKIKNLKESNLLVFADKNLIPREIQKVGKTNYSYLWLCKIQKSALEEATDLKMKFVNDVEIATTIPQLKKIFENPVEDYNGKRFVDPTSYEFKLTKNVSIYFRRKCETELPFLMLVEELADAELNNVKEIIEMEPENSFAQAQFVFLQEEFLSNPSDDAQELAHELKQTQEIIDSFNTVISKKPRHFERISNMAKIYDLKYQLLLKLLGKADEEKLKAQLADKTLSQLDLGRILHLLLLNHVYTAKESDVYHLLKEYFNIA